MSLDIRARGISSAQVEALLDALALEPCHVTGMHDPNHTDRYLCDIQKSALVDRILEALDLTPADLPHKLHDDCYWCHNIPNQETYREKLRKLWTWAGIKHPEELVATAPDGHFPGDEDAMLAVLTDEPQTWPDVWRALGWNSTRAGLAFSILVDRDLATWVAIRGVADRRVRRTTKES